MAENITLARPYAKAIFAEAEQTQQLPAWETMLSALSEVARQDVVRKNINNPAILPEQWVDLFQESVKLISKNISEAQNKHLHRFLILLANGQRLVLLPAIHTLFKKMLDEKERIVPVTFISAQPLSDELKIKVQKALEKKFNADVQMQCELDESLIGGALIRKGDWVIDGSIKGKIARLAESLY